MSEERIELTDLDPKQLRILAKRARDQARDTMKDFRSRGIYWDDEADGLYLLAAAIRDKDVRGAERAFAGLEKEIQDVALDCKKETDGMVQIPGVLEIDPNRGVMYFHDESTGMSVLRICRLPTPIPIPSIGDLLDITHMHGASWSKSRVVITDMGIGKEETPS
jgi:hypothetical protein